MARLLVGDGDWGRIEIGGLRIRWDQGEGTGCPRDLMPIGAGNGPRWSRATFISSPHRPDGVPGLGREGTGRMHQVPHNPPESEEPRRGPEGLARG